MRYFVCTFLLVVTTGMSSGVQQQHELKYCINHGGFEKEFPMVEPHICTCDKPCADNQPEDTKCKVYCRKDRCFCIAECDIS